MATAQALIDGEALVERPPVAIVLTKVDQIKKKWWTKNDRRAISRISWCDSGVYTVRRSRSSTRRQSSSSRCSECFDAMRCARRPGGSRSCSRHGIRSRRKDSIQKLSWHANCSLNQPAGCGLRVSLEALSVAAFEEHAHQIISILI